MISLYTKTKPIHLDLQITVVYYKTSQSRLPIHALLGGPPCYLCLPPRNLSVLFRHHVDNRHSHRMSTIFYWLGSYMIFPASLTAYIRVFTGAKRSSLPVCLPPRHLLAYSVPSEIVHRTFSNIRDSLSLFSSSKNILCSADAGEDYICPKLLHRKLMCSFPSSPQSRLTA